MALDYTPIYEGTMKWGAFVTENNLTFEDLREETLRLYEATHTILDEAVDADISFVPHDPNAHDAHAPEGKQHIGWTLGHLIAHATATNEETFVFGSLLARGIPQGGRIRVEAAWEEIDTVAKARQRLNESRRIVLSYLDAIPDAPDLETERVFSERAAAYFGPINALASVLMGLTHHNEHLPQMEEALCQAKAAVEQVSSLC